MKKILVVLLIIVLTYGYAHAIEFEETFDSCDGTCTPCALVDETWTPENSWDFNWCKFGGTDSTFTESWQSTGGVNNSGYALAVMAAANGRNQVNHNYSSTANDGDFYWRACFKFGGGWWTTSPSSCDGAAEYQSALLDQKVTYEYYSGGIAYNLFFHSGSVENNWSGERGELSYYMPSGAWQIANGSGNSVRHTNYFNIVEHEDEWFCVVVHVDIDQNPWEFDVWLTTEWGASNCSAGTTCQDGDGHNHFNNYRYMNFTEARAASYVTGINWGMFSNECVGYGASIAHDEIKMSDSLISSNPFTGSTPTRKLNNVTGVRVTLH